MHYQIRFPNGERVPIETLNAEAANLWDVNTREFKGKYTFPKGDGVQIRYNEDNSWHDMIGYAIIHPQLVGAGGQMQQTWAQIKETLFNAQIHGGDIWEKKCFELQMVVKLTVDYLEPYFELIDLWYSKGYIPVKTK